MNTTDEDEQLTSEEPDVLEEVLDEIGEQVESAAMSFATDGNPKLERMGIRYFSRRSRQKGVVQSIDALHVLNEAELERIRAIVWAAMGWAALFGFLAGVISGLAEVLAEPLYLGADRSFTDNWRYHGVVHGVTIVATLVEVWLLYAVGLSAAHDLAHAAGLSFQGADTDEAPGPQKEAALSLARAALELPNPPANNFGIDPYRALPKWQVVLTVLIYKLKVTITTFIAKVLIARTAGRVGLKSWLAFVSAPVTAIWDAAAMWLVLRQVKIRVIGQSAATELFAAISKAHPSLSSEAIEAMARAVAAAVVMSGELHPNHVLLMRQVPTVPANIEDLDETQILRHALVQLERSEQVAVLEVMGLALLIDGRLGRNERELWRDLATQCGYAPSTAALATLARQFSRGRPWKLSALTRSVTGP